MAIIIIIIIVIINIRYCNTYIGFPKRSVHTVHMLFNVINWGSTFKF